MAASSGQGRVNAHQREGPAVFSSAMDEWYEVTSDGRCVEGRSSAEMWSRGALVGTSSPGEGGSSLAQAVCEHQPRTVPIELLWLYARGEVTTVRMVEGWAR